MFKNILSFIHGSNFMNQSLGQFKQILDLAELMYEKATKRLINGEESPNLKQEIYDMDQQINALEKNIRKGIVEHLVLQPTVDVSACLVLMSVVKDAERLGDYCKNLYELVELMDGSIDYQEYQKLFNGIQEELSGFFAETKIAFIESDEKIAVQSWEQKLKIAKRCDEIVSQLAKSKIKVNDAVCFTLMARYFKRLSAHLVNISTSVVLPVDKLDYYDEKRMED